jgi:hypothetical protein
MAAVASLLPWPWLGYSDNFLCFEITDLDVEITDLDVEIPDFDDYRCGSLYLNTPSYWSDPTSGEFGAAQAATVFAIFSTALGFVAFLSPRDSHMLCAGTPKALDDCHYARSRRRFVHLYVDCWGSGLV